MYARTYGITAKAMIATIETKFFILNPFKKLSIVTRIIIRVRRYKVNLFYLYPC